MDRAADITAQNLFGLVHKEYYEPLSRYKANDIFTSKLRELIPGDSHEFIRSDVWLHVLDKTVQSKASTDSYITQGFKIHVSCTPKCALSILETFVPILLKEKINFKLACDGSILNQLNSKTQPRGYAGKFMTIYPLNREGFKDLIEKLYQASADKDFMGPYILSDKRYKDSRVLYYRYGGFNPGSRLNLDGSQTSCLISPEGEYVPDERHPYFELPKWETDPFNQKTFEGEGEGTLLNERYVVEGVFGFSNAGGVYFGKDTLTDKEVVIKEARPFTNYWKVDQEHWDAVYLLEREYKILEHLKDLDFIPNPIELFEDWEHTFLAEERVHGMSLDSFWAGEEQILGPYIRRKGTIGNFVKKFRKVSIALMKMVKAIHQKGVLLGDMSPRNIIIDGDTLQCWLIDFESAVFMEDNEQILQYATQWGTEGFINPERKHRKKLTPKDDLYALGMTLYNCVVPVNNIFTLNTDAKSLFIDEFVNLGLPEEVKQVIYMLLEGDEAGAMQTLEEWDDSKPYKEVPASSAPQAIKASKEKIGKVIREVSKYINNSADHQRKDRLWPAHYPVFITNPMSVAYGACGTVLFLTSSGLPISKETIAWLSNQKLDNDHFPPGLFIGLAGIAYTFNEAGMKAEAEQIMETLYQSPMLYEEAGIYLGVSGWGMVSLYFYIETGNKKYLEHAVKAGEHLIATAEDKDGNYYWPYGDTIHYGYGYGASGIGLFLLNLYVATLREDFQNFAVKALEYDLEAGTDSKVGIQWKRFEDDVLLYPYFIHGSAGIGSVLIRFYEVLGDERYKAQALKIADDTYIKYSFIPSQFEGLAGIGEFMIDAWSCSGDNKYYLYALDIAESVLWFGIQKEEGMAFPGRWLTRIANDYATGSAGIGLFLFRLINPQPKHFMDLDIDKLAALRKASGEQKPITAT